MDVPADTGRVDVNRMHAIYGRVSRLLFLSGAALAGLSDREIVVCGRFSAWQN
jgi:hypothetical protein